MANNEFNNIDEFIDGFSRIGPASNNTKYDGIIWGIEFSYRNKIYRITRDPIGCEDQLKAKFGMSKNACIKFFEIPLKKYPDTSNIPIDLFLGIYDDVQDLLENGNIDFIPLKNIIASDETEILAID